jgi:arylsulfatase A-like enzyme
VFIVADDMNGYGFYGTFPNVKTPALDAFKESAVTFTRAYCNAPSCVPSRASFLSGRLPSSTGSYLNGSDPWDKPAFADIESLPEVFKRSGYHSWGAGKLFHARITPERERRAFDNQPWGGGFGPFVPEPDQLAGKWWGATPCTGPDSDFPDVKNAEAAVAYLQEEHTEPFFLMLGLWRPHTPFTAPKRFFELYDEEQVPLPPASWVSNDLADVPEAGRELARVWGERWDKTGADHLELWRRIVWGYLACTSFADWSVGRVIQALDASPYAENTLVILTSDNGYHCGEKDHFEKSTLWEAAAQVPLAIRLPGSRRAGTVTAEPVSLVDLFPTLVEYCGLNPPGQGLDGQSLRRLLEEPGAVAQRPAITLYEEHYFSASDGRHRYIVYPDGTEEVYDHQADPYEHRNLAKDPAAESIRQGLRKWLPTHWAKSLGGRKG